MVLWELCQSYQILKRKNFLVTNCDTIIKYDFTKICKLHLKNQNSLTMIVVKKKYVIPFGVIDQNTKKKEFFLKMRNHNLNI